MLYDSHSWSQTYPKEPHLVNMSFIYPVYHVYPCYPPSSAIRYSSILGNFYVAVIPVLSTPIYYCMTVCRCGFTYFPLSITPARTKPSAAIYHYIHYHIRTTPMASTTDGDRHRHIPSSFHSFVLRDGGLQVGERCGHSPPIFPRCGVGKLCGTKTSGETAMTRNVGGATLERAGRTCSKTATCGTQHTHWRRAVQAGWAARLMVCCRCLLGSRRGCSPGQAQPASSYLTTSDYASTIVQHPQESRTQIGTVGTKKRYRRKATREDNTSLEVSRSK